MAKLPMNVLAFTADNAEARKGYEKFIEYYNTFSANKTSNDNGVSLAEMDSKMLKLFTDEVERISGQKMSDCNDLAVYCNRTAVREAAFEVAGMITDLIIPSALIKDMGIIAEVKNGGWGETLTVEMQPRDLFTVVEAGRGRRTTNVTSQYKGNKTINPTPHEITVGLSLYDILSGQRSLAEFVSKAVLSIEANIRKEAYDAFAATMKALPNTGSAALRISGFSQDTAIALAQKVQAWNGGNKAVFVGTKLALSNILPASTMTRINVNDDYVHIGYLRDFFGFTTLELEQSADYSTEFGVTLSDSEIYIISPGVDKMVKIFIEGSTLVNTDSNYASANLQVAATLYKSYGIGVFSSALAGVIEL